MFDCKNLLHPFQNDPGISQRQRVIDYLLSETIKIDGRSLADLLNFFAKLSNGINYYDKELNVSDWRPFFARSLPFLLASISRFDDNSSSGKFELYRSFFKKQPSRSGLQLIIHFIFYNTIYKIDNWYENIKDNNLPIEPTLEDIIRNKLSPLLKKFIALSNAASKWFCIKRVDFTGLLDTAENDVWGLQLHDLYATNEDFKKLAIGKCARMKVLYDLISALFCSFIEAMKAMKDPSEKSIDLSLVPARNELRENHPPHLALIFAFIRLFQRMQGELNSKTKQHLNYFYTEVLRIKPADARPDKVHVIFELQKILQNQLQKYKLDAGIDLNAGRDEKNADIIFETDEQIVVNEAQVEEVRTLFLKNENIYQANFLEGVYIASSANKADGVEKDFKEDPKNWYTVGNKFSKYIEPGRTRPKPHPFARLGFVLASQVLYLKEGSRLVDITLDCSLSDSICNDIADLCKQSTSGDCPDYPGFYDASKIYQRVQNFLINGGTPLKYININDQLLEEAVSLGISTVTAEKIRDRFLLIPNDLNECTGAPKYNDSEVVESGEWDTFLTTYPSVKDEVNKLPDLFKTKFPLKIHFSGEKEWVEPSNIETLSMSALVGMKFTLKLGIRLEADKPSVTFFNKEALKEDLGTELPLVKIELDDSLKIKYVLKEIKPECCLEKLLKDKQHFVSLYHFFRNVTIHANTKIDVNVCGLKNFIVQNDENIMDVNSPMYPFGTRPKINSNFYIGSEEILLKNWTGIWININWKDLPKSPPAPNQNELFKTYYNGYQNVFLNSNTVSDEVLDAKFKVEFSLLLDGQWKNKITPDCINPNINDLLFQLKPLVSPDPPKCDNSFYTHQFSLVPNNFVTAPDLHYENIAFKGLKKFDVNTRNSFLKLTLKCQDFQHDRYPFVLARQMAALGKLPELIDGAVYFNITAAGQYQVLNINDLFKDIVYASKLANDSTLSAGGLGSIKQKIAFFKTKFNPVTNNVTSEAACIARFYDNITKPQPPGVHTDIKLALDDIFDKLKARENDIANFVDRGVVIPNPPWTPIISNISIDYIAKAEIAEVHLIHLYPYAGTYKPEEIELAPTLFPTFCDEGTLFIGLKDLETGSNLNVLFQLAEATADSETGREEVHWHYLENNSWKPLRTGFEVLNDATLDLTSTGIIQFSLPENMTNQNTVMPANLYWIKASLAKNSRSVSETFNIHTQAMSAIFTISPSNDLSRLDKPLNPSTIGKLLIADPAIKSVSQPYESFGGRLAEIDSSYYLRVSERLRHKGRAIQKWDYERLVLEEFPIIFKAKCINHSFHTDAHIYENDVPYAPGYVLLAVIPDLKKLKAGNSFEPRAPVSLLEKIELYLEKITSPFVRLKAGNPRYEKIHFCITVQLKRGMDENYFREKLKQDLSEFMAPWAIGKYDKLSFGQCVYRSDVIRFLERTGYVDFVLKLEMQHENELKPLDDYPKICPLSPRSILVAGEINIIIVDEKCPTWCEMPPRTIRCDGPVLVNDYCIEINDNGIIT